MHKQTTFSRNIKWKGRKHMKLNIKETIEKVADAKLVKGSNISGVVYIHNFDIKASTNGKQFISGQFSDQGVILPFKVWSDHIEEFKALADKKIISMSGTIDTWNNTASVVIEKIEPDIFGYCPADFLLGHDRIKLEKATKKVFSSDAESNEFHQTKGNE